MREIPYGTYARLSANARGGLFDAGRSVPKPSINPQTRNKGDDRLAEGHERVAGTVMVLRTFSDRAPFPRGCHGVYLG